ncbi:hypothetical protein [Oceanobacillus kapialis]|uniref:Uncharacterized protein n=1 Tax=Oceanobacillus kapialis TaxID=481353 RepID=A0ABW5PZG9_9BACI
MTHEEMSNKDLLKVFRQAAQDLPGGGAHARSFYYDLEEEILSRMEGEKNVTAATLQDGGHA